MKIINLKKNIKSLTKEQQNHMKMQFSLTFVEKNLKINLLKIKFIIKFGTIVIIQGNKELLPIAYIT